MSLFTKLLLMCLIPAASNASSYEEAAKRAAEAAFKQLDGQRYMDELVNRHVAEDVKKTLQKLGFYGRILVEQRVEVKWTF